MKQIEIEGKSYNIDCNAFTPVQYKAFFKESKRNSKRHASIKRLFSQTNSYSTRS